MFLSPANEDSAHVLSRFFRDEETAASTKETVSGAAAAGDTDLDLDDLVERLDTVGQKDILALVQRQYLKVLFQKPL